MRLVARLFLAVAVAALPVALALASCGTDAENIDACRQIESARCELAPSCSAGFDVAGCKRYYRDACLLGTGYPDAGDVGLIQPCITALQACVATDASATMGCPGQVSLAGAKCQALQPTASDGGLVLGAVDPTPCNIVMHCPEVLQACAWVSFPDAGVDAAGDAGTGGGGTGGSGTGGSGTGGGNADGGG